MVGYIEIKDKIFFVYHEFPKPHENGYLDRLPTYSEGYKIAMKIYEKSKRKIEISNEIFRRSESEIIMLYPPHCYLFDGKKVEAEIKNNKARITKTILK